MANTVSTNISIPAEKFTFVQLGDRISDKKMDDKPIGYFKDAMIRFRKNKASVVAFFIILAVVLFSVIAPLVNTRYDSSFLDVTYRKKPPRVLLFKEWGLKFMDGATQRDFSENSLIKAISIGVGAEDWEGNGDVTIKEGMASQYNPVVSIDSTFEKVDGTKKKAQYWNARIDEYLETGFAMQAISQSELPKILEWEQQTGLHILYPLIEENEFSKDPLDAEFANTWYKIKRNDAVKTYVEDGKVMTQKLKYNDNTVLEENYKRDAEGNVIYYEFTGGGTLETAQYKIRVLYYNWYLYNNGFEPQYLLGTDSIGYDLALRTADGIRLSLIVSVIVTVVTFIIGALYGAFAGYYGGTVDIIMERITDILSGIPFIVVATLFQIYLAQKVGAIGCLLFAYISTGWIGNAALVRTQFYRFKTQEYVMAARTLGASDWRLITKHIFPNSLGTIVTSCALDIPGIILSESSLAFLGIMKLTGNGTTSLGVLLSDAQANWTTYPHLMLIPALVISLLMISFNLFGNGLRDAFNPSLRGVED